MLYITLNDQTPDLNEEVEGRTHYGWNPDAPLTEMWEDNRTVWTLGPRADAERHVAFAYRGRIVMVGTIDRITDAPRVPGKRTIEGKVFGPGDVYHDALVGKSTPYSGRDAQGKRFLTEGDVLEITLGAANA